MVPLCFYGNNKDPSTMTISYPTPILTLAEMHGNKCDFANRKRDSDL